MDLYTIARGLDHYIWLIRRLPDSRREGSDSLGFILRPSVSQDAGRIGADAAPIKRSLGIGVNWKLWIVQRGHIREYQEEGDG